MTRPFPFFPLAFVLFLTVLVGPSIREASKILASTNAHHRDALYVVQEDRGVDINVVGIWLDVPVGRKKVRLNPSAVDMSVSLTSNPAVIGGATVPQPRAEIVVTSWFDAADLDAVLADDERPDWRGAELRWPVTYSKSLDGGPMFSSPEGVLPFRLESAVHNRAAYVLPVRAVPTEPITVSVTKIGLAPDIVFFVGPSSADITLESDRPLEKFDGVAPSVVPTGLLSREYRWTLVAEAGRQRAERPDAPRDREKGEFLGIQMREPDDVGDPWMHTGFMTAPYHRVDAAMRHVPAIAAVLALLLFIGRSGGWREFAGTAIVVAGALAAAIWMSPRVGSELAWQALAVLGGLGTTLALYRSDRAWRLLIALVFATLWMGLWHLPSWSFRVDQVAVFQRLLTFVPLGSAVIAVLAAVAGGGAIILRRSDSK